MKINFDELKRHLLTGTSHAASCCRWCSSRAFRMLNGKGAVPEGVFAGVFGTWELQVSPCLFLY